MIFLPDVDKLAFMFVEDTYHVVDVVFTLLHVRSSPDKNNILKYW